MIETGYSHGLQIEMANGLDKHRGSDIFDSGRFEFDRCRDINSGSQSGKVQESPLSPPLRTGHETFALIRLKPYFKRVNLVFECSCR
jgi:hypothetical protein